MWELVYFVVIWLTHKKVRVGGSTVVVVTCRNCGEKYRYLLKRTAKGDSPSREQARQIAHQRLRLLLANSIDPVPCPFCGWFQKKMIPLLHKRRLPRMRSYALALVFVGILVAVLGLLMLKSFFERGDKAMLAPAQTLLGIAAAMVLSGIALLLVRHFKNANYNPNDPESEQERIELGRSLGITQEEAEQLMSDMTWEE